MLTPYLAYLRALIGCHHSIQCSSEDLTGSQHLHISVALGWLKFSPNKINYIKLSKFIKPGQQLTLYSQKFADTCPITPICNFRTSHSRFSPPLYCYNQLHSSGKARFQSMAVRICGHSIIKASVRSGTDIRQGG